MLSQLAGHTFTRAGSEKSASGNVSYRIKWVCINAVGSSVA